MSFFGGGGVYDEKASKLNSFLSFFRVLNEEASTLRKKFLNFSKCKLRKLAT